MSLMVNKIKNLMEDDNIENDETVDQTIDNLNSALLKISQNLLNDVAQDKHEYSIKEAKDIASIVSSLSNLDSQSTNTDGQLPSSPSPINVFYNSSLGATDKTSEDDDESDVSNGLDNLSDSQVKEMLENTNDLKNKDNYEINSK